MAVLDKARIKASSPNSLVKFANPTNSIAPVPFHFSSESTRENTMGTSVKTAKPRKFGNINEYAITFLETLRAFFFMFLPHPSRIGQEGRAMRPAPLAG
jgi:hypothetical protein